jgi:hypothetical protein
MIILETRMKGKFLLLMFHVLVSFAADAQTFRYFQFKTTCGHGNWQDSSFIAAASDLGLIDSVMANLSRPLNQRKFINGLIDHGNGGFNHNAAHWFSWHFIPDQWDLVELAMEVCDGCPYTDLDSDTAYWIGNIGRFCPWTGVPVKEVSSPVLQAGQISCRAGGNVYPNPARDRLNIKCNKTKGTFVEIFNSVGRIYTASSFYSQEITIDLSQFSPGLYFVKINGANKVFWIEKIVIID